jgi:hypothetical protein
MKHLEEAFALIGAGSKIVIESSRTPQLDGYVIDGKDRGYFSASSDSLLELISLLDLQAEEWLQENQP